MRLLLDSHVRLWWAGDDGRLGSRARAAIDDEGNDVLLSAATVWELAIKVAAGRLEVPEDFVDRALAEGLQPLEIGIDHARAAAALPRHHGDPFDRILVAQAMGESLTLVTAEELIARYAAPVLPAGL